MARILVEDDDGRTVLLDERDVRSEHFDDGHSAAQFIERVELAMRDERTRVRRRRHTPIQVTPESALTHTFD